VTGIKRNFSFAQSLLDQEARSLAGPSGFLFLAQMLLVGVVSTAVPCWSQPAQKPLPAGITLVDVTAQTHLLLPTVSRPASAQTLQKPIASSEYSLEFARRVLLPAIGGSVAAYDLDGSGYPDVYVVVPGASNHFFRNLKNGTFEETTKKAGVAGTGSDLSATFADYDRSGHASLFVAGLGGVRVYHSNGDGSFTDVTEKTGIKSMPGQLATSAVLFDAEGNGTLDLLVTVYTDLNAPPTKPTFIFPNDFASARSHLYHNQGNGTFREINVADSLDENPGRTRKALAADFSRSGHLDLLLLRDNKPPALFANKGEARFEDKTWQAGGENWKYAYVDGQVSDFNHDGKLDIALWSTIGNEVLTNQGDGTFEQDRTFPIVFAANRPFGFHGATADLKADGYDDLLVVDNNGEWHYIANHLGTFALAQLALQGSGTNKRDRRQSVFPDLSCLVPVRVQRSERITLIGVRTDGRLIALRPRATQKKPAPQSHN
jgi:FG-GAP-like repeat